LTKADPDADFRTIRALTNAAQRRKLPHPNQSLLFQQPPMNSVAKAAAQALAAAAIAAACAGCPTPPHPPPPAAPTRVVVIYESSNLDPADAATINSHELRAYLDAHGHWYRMADKDILNEFREKPPEILPYLDAADGHPLPWLLLADANHKITLGQHLPPSAAEVIALLQRKSP